MKRKNLHRKLSVAFKTNLRGLSCAVRAKRFCLGFSDEEKGECSKRLSVEWFKKLQGMILSRVFSSIFLILGMLSNNGLVGVFPVKNRPGRNPEFFSQFSGGFIRQNRCASAELPSSEGVFF